MCSVSVGYLTSRIASFQGFGLTRGVMIKNSNGFLDCDYSRYTALSVYEQNGRERLRLFTEIPRQGLGNLSLGFFRGFGHFLGMLIKNSLDFLNFDYPSNVELAVYKQNGREHHDERVTEISHRERHTVYRHYHNGRIVGYPNGRFISLLQQTFFSNLHFRSYSTKTSDIRVYITLLPANTTKDDLLRFFSGYGIIHDIYIQKEHKYARVSFSNKIEAMEAVKSLNWMKIHTKNVMVQLENVRPVIGEVDWEEYRKSFLQYSPDLLLEHAQFYFNNKPRNLVQAAEKTWFSCSYTIKIFALKNKIELSSYNSIRDFWEAVVPELPPTLQFALINGFNSGESLHKFASCTYIKFNEFVKHMDNVKKMVITSKEITDEMMEKAIQKADVLKKCKKINEDPEIGPDNDLSNNDVAVICRAEPPNELTVMRI